MKIICSGNGIVDCERPRQGFIDLQNAGFSSVLLDLKDLCKINRIKTEEDFLKIRDTLLEKLQHEKKVIDLLKVRVLDFLYEDYKKIIIDCISLCKEIDCKKMIVEPVSKDIAKDEILSLNTKLFREVLEIAKEHRVKILFENQCKSHNGHLIRGFCSSEKDILNFLYNLSCFEQNIGFCLNIGTCNSCGQSTYDMIGALENRIDAVIFSDCDGDKEQSLLPFSCVNNGSSMTDWLNIIRGLREINFNGDFILEMEDTAKAFSPLLRPQLLSLAKATMDYFKWQIQLEQLIKKYDKRVLFGAGNMCRNYMKNYGKKYPPLFTCDNNKNMWGTTFDGLEVKNPEELKNLPKDVAIFICNIYYRDIEQQLKIMGLENPIVYFNDEYLGSFHFDRIETIKRVKNGT